MIDERSHREEKLLRQWLEEHHFDSVDDPEERERLLADGRRVVTQLSASAQRHPGGAGQAVVAADPIDRDAESDEPVRLGCQIPGVGRASGVPAK